VLYENITKTKYRLGFILRRIESIYNKKQAKHKIAEYCSVTKFLLANIML